MSQLLLITGFQRGGTSLLAACLGRHPEINMLYESTGYEVLAGYGKRYNANKLLLYRQIRYNQRANRWGYMVNRITNRHFWGRKQHMTRPYPTSRMSISDYLNHGARVIVILRDRTDTINSMQNRMGQTREQASREYTMARHEADRISTANRMTVRYNDLVENPGRVLRLICDWLDLKWDDRMLQGPQFNEAYNEFSTFKTK